jgi:phosphoheptose isomerase
VISDVLARLVVDHPSLGVCIDSVGAAVELLTDSFRADGTLLVCGNGGSAADADHIVGELMKGFVLPRPVPDAFRERICDGYLADHLQCALRAVSLTGHPGLATAFGNDVAADMVFAQQVYGYGRVGDVLLALSTSGNSANVCNAIKVAAAQGLGTVGLTGASGGDMKALCDICICVPQSETHKVQELHLPVYHALCLVLEDRFFGSGAG